MDNKTLFLSADQVILHLKLLATGKEEVRRKLAVTAEKLATTARKLAVIAQEKEGVRRKLAVTAREKEKIRRELEITAEKLAVTAERLATTAQAKESARRHKLVATAEKLASTAEELAATAKEKERVRRKLAVTAAKLAVTAEKLVVTAEKLAVTAEKLAATAREKESVRRKLVVTAAKLAATAQEKENVRRKLVVTAREKETARRKLAVTAEKLKHFYGTLEEKVRERTKSLEMARVKEEAILLSVGDGLLATDEKGKITFINKMAEKLLGKKNKEVVGKKYFDVLPLEDENGALISPEKHPVNIVLATRAATATLATAYYKRADKERFPFAIKATPVILEGKIIGTIKLFRDITYEREIDKAKTEFVSLASHQLRTPLSTVNWYTEMLLERDVGELNEKQKKYLDEVYRSNQRMVELVNALLNVASLELGTFAIEPEPVDICLLTENVINEQKSQINDRNLQFSFSCEKSIPLMQADPRLLHMVMQNILSNAVKYTAKGGKIDFTITLADKKNVLLKISDTGYGIPKNQQAQIFTKLFRADNVRDKDTDGTGLGLYIVKSIVENTGGKIWFRSGGKKGDKGTTFYVTLPLHEATKSIK